MDKKTASSKEKKSQEVEKLKEKIASAKTLIFADYRGLTSEQLGELRAKVKKAGGEILITKNTLLKIALVRNKLPVTSDQLEGPTAAVFAFDDEIAPVRELSESNKALGIPTFKFGYFGKDQLDSSQIENLAKIPGKQTLQAQLVGQLFSPISRIVGVLSANLKNLVYVLNAAAQKG